MTKTTLTRRGLLAFPLAMIVPTRSLATDVQEIRWDDLIPPGVPHAEIIGEGEMDEINDTWKPIYDSNANRFNAALEGKTVRLPGYVVPLDMSGEGTSTFLLVPYVGACIHVPPPPPNQLVLVSSEQPWSTENLWAAVWVTGQLTAAPQSTELAEVGYRMSRAEVEIYEW